MKYIDFTFDSPYENLACDEALLDLCEDGFDGEILRFWESPTYFIVLGYSNKTESEVHLAACRAADVPILRRCSGGGTVLQGPGCLNYSLILKINGCLDLHSITATNRYILERNRQALAPLIKDKVTVEGISDLVVGGLKFSGNAQRRKRNAILFHGTFLYRFDLAKIENTLKIPEKQPEYRLNRSHAKFVTNIGLAPEAIKQALRNHWKAFNLFDGVPKEKIRGLLPRYRSDEWNLKF